MGSGGGGQSQPSSTTTVQNLPAFLETAYQKAIDRAEAASKETLPVYQGQRVANFSPATQRALDMSSTSIGQYNPVLNAGINATAAAATPFDAATFAKFNDPYKSQVVDEMARLGNKNFTDNLMPTINSQFTGNGMFNSSRNAVELGRAATDTQRNITGQQADYLSKGFAQSMNDYQNAMQRQLAGGAQLGNQASQGQAMSKEDIARLTTAGAAQEAKTQQGLDIGYNEFLEQRDRPRNDILFYSNIAHGTPVQGLTTTQTQNLAAAGNPLTNAISAAGSAYQLGQLGNSNGSRTYAKGGKVKAKKQAAKKTQSQGIGSLMYG